MTKDSSSKRTTITNGIRPFRYVFAVVGFFMLASLFEEFTQMKLLILLSCLILFYLFYKIRRVQFDNHNIYRVYGKNEKVLSFSSIESIKKTGIKINGTRMWKVTYRDEYEKKRKFLFKEGTFQHGSTQELIDVVKKVNPEVVIWTHPFFNHPEEKKKK